LTHLLLDAVERSLNEQELRIRSATEANRSIWPQVLMNLRDRLTIAGSVQKKLASRTKRLPREGGARMPVLDQNGAKVPITGTLPVLASVEPLTQGLCRNLTNLIRIKGIMSQ
jgi:hypothetical protein